jgi:hypothetical protein
MVGSSLSSKLYASRGNVAKLKGITGEPKKVHNVNIFKRERYRKKERE